MKLLIASDIHGDVESTKILLNAFKTYECDKILLLGDILYHGPRNNLPKQYSPKEVIELLNGYKDRILCVRGNCDTEVDQMVLEFPIMADYALLCIDGLYMYATHGHKYNEITPPPMYENDILIHGHTHVIRCEKFGNNNTYLNPGSITLPKENCPRSFMIYNDKKISVFNSDLKKINEYNL